MRKYVIGIVVVFLLVIFNPAFASEEELSWEGNFNTFWGVKLLDQPGSSSYDEKWDVGLEYDFRRRDWPINIAIDLFYSFEQNNICLPGGGKADHDTRITDINIGIRKLWQLNDDIRAFAGGGPALISFYEKIESIHDRDMNPGYWIHGGAYWTFNDLNVGIEIRHTNADVHVFGINREAGGEHYGLIIGYNWDM